MSTAVSQRELRNENASIMRRVEQGEHFTVTRNGVPVAELVPIGTTGSDNRRSFVPVAEIASKIEHVTPWVVDRFAKETRLLDEAIDDRDVDHWA